MYWGPCCCNACVFTASSGSRCTARTPVRRLLRAQRQAHARPRHAKETRAWPRHAKEGAILWDPELLPEHPSYHSYAQYCNSYGTPKINAKQGRASHCVSRSHRYEHRAGQKKQAFLKTAERDIARLRGSLLRLKRPPLLHSPCSTAQALFRLLRHVIECSQGY